MKKQKRNIFGIIIAVILLSFLFVLIPKTVHAAYNTGDDYPEVLKTADKDALIDPWRFLNRECTSFVAWCLNSRNEVNFTNFYLGYTWSDAINWGYVAQRAGFTVDQNPAVGSVAWWDNGYYGHVAWVSAVDGDWVTIEEYNAVYVGGYNTGTIHYSNPTGYIHIKDLGEPVVTGLYTGIIDQDGQLIYLNRGEWDTSYTSIVRYQGDWYYVKNGVVDFNFTGLASNENGWWYVKDGIVDFSYTGFASNENGWWYVENSKITFEKEGIIWGNANTGAGAQGEEAWWYVKNSKVTVADTIAQNANGWWKITGGKVDFTFLGLASNENGWWYLKNGKVDFSYNGFESNENGWWYVEDGKITFQKTEVIWGTANTEIGVAGEEDWWYVKNSKVTAADDIAPNENGWWKVKNGRVDFTFQGFAPNENGWWYIRNGKVNFDKNDVMKCVANTDPYAAGEEDWWLVRYGKVTNDTTVAENVYGWWYVKEGRVDFTFQGFVSNEYGWWYLENGKVGFNKNDIMNGFANTDPCTVGEEGWWLVRGSKVSKETTVAQNSNGWWYVNQGKVDFAYTGIQNNSYGWWRIEDGKVNFGFTGLAENEYGTWYLESGKVNFGYNGTYDDKKIVNGKVQEDINEKEQE